VTGTEQPSTILVVDDQPQNIDLLTRVLAPFYRTRVALDGEKALRIAFSEDPPDLILLDVMLPGLDGFQICERLKRNPDTRAIPVIFITGMSEIEDERKGLQLGAVDYLTKPISPHLVLARVQTHLALYDQARELTRLVNLRTAELNNSRLQIIRRLGRAAEFRDNETGNHIIRMSHFSRLLSQAAGFGENFTEMLFNAAPMHDVGKIGVPDHILLKQGRLDAEEWAIMRQHAQMGADIIGDHCDELLQAARTIALCHHEKWDGSGYPRGLRGEEIPLMARVIAIADVFDALTSERPYKKAWAVEDALDYIEQQAGRHFDPALIEPFRQALPDILHIREKYADRHGALLDTDLA